MLHQIKIIGLTIVRNAISNGYLIAEVINTLSAVADEVVVCDGFSTDGTYEYLKTRSDIKLFQDDWNLQSNNGLEFARVTDLGIKRCDGDFIFYLQADELIHPNQIPHLKELIRSNKYNSIDFRFNHIRYDLDCCLREGYEHAARVVRNKNVQSRDDGYDFQGEVNPKHVSQIDIYHYGYVFLENILAKMINHSSNSYVDAPNYARRKELAGKYLEQIKAGENLDPLELQKSLEPEYTLGKHGLPMPPCIRRLRHASKYELPSQILKRYYFDLDETLCLTPASRDYSKVIPLHKMIEDVNRLYEEGHEITIFTARGGSSGVDYHELNVQQLADWGVKYDYLYDKNKPQYDILIDDKAFNTEAWRAKRKIQLIGFVASCFDLLHAGHCLYLEDARSKCDYLVAALHIDPTIDRADKNKPIQTLEERRIQLRSCKYIDEIIEYKTEADLVRILESVKPDIRFVGSDTDPTIVTGVEHCKSVYVHDRSHNYSSSELRRRIHADL